MRGRRSLLLGLVAMTLACTVNERAASAGGPLRRLFGRKKSCCCQELTPCQIAACAQAADTVFHGCYEQCINQGGATAACRTHCACISGNYYSQCVSAYRCGCRPPCMPYCPDPCSPSNYSKAMQVAPLANCSTVTSKAQADCQRLCPTCNCTAYASCVHRKCQDPLNTENCAQHCPNCPSPFPTPIPTPVPTPDAAP